MSVASLPGGAKLVELINKVTADQGAIHGIAQRWRHAGSVTDSAGRALTAATNGVDGVWRGPAAESFVRYMAGFANLCGTTHSRLDTAATNIDEAGQLLDSARRTVQNRCDALVAEANTVRASLPDTVPQDEVNAILAALVDEVYAELVPIVQGVEAELSAMAARLTSTTEGDGFQQYPEPNTAAFVPQPAATGPQSSATGVHGPSGAAGGGGTAGAGGAAGGGHGFGGYGSSGPPPPGGGPAPQGQVAEWIRQAIEILKAHGYPVDKMNPNDIWLIIQHESAGDPSATNNWDSNAAKGTPSKGLMQTIDPTFNAYSLPGHKNIYDPVDNIIAGIRYAIERYGSVSNVPGVVGVKNGTGYRGY